MVAARHSVGRVLVQTRNSLYVCRSCKYQLTRVGTGIKQQRFVSNEGTPVEERPGRTSHLPSLKNHYGRLDSSENKRARRKPVLDAMNRMGQTHQSITETSPQPSNPRTQAEQYFPAETWEDLEYVGYSKKANWRNAPARDQDEWLDSMPATTIDRKQLISYLHQAAVECLTCEQAGLDPANTIYLDSTQYSTNAIDAFSSATIEVTPSGTPGQVRFATEAQAKEVVEVFTSVDKAMNNQKYDATMSKSGIQDHEISLEAETMLPVLRYNVQDESFLKLRLSTDGPITFTILKRFSRLSGRRIADHILNTTLSSNKPLSFLIDQLHDQLIQAQPKKIADILMASAALAGQSNVMIFPRRETPVDKEKELGRWKVIERELHDRGLPSFGKPSQRNH